jgi:hypothetical protein
MLFTMNSILQKILTVSNNTCSHSYTHLKSQAARQWVCDCDSAAVVHCNVSHIDVLNPLPRQMATNFPPQNSAPVIERPVVANPAPLVDVTNAKESGMFYS